MALLDLQGMELAETPGHGHSSHSKSCGGASTLSLLLC
jgi:hypothetical protein